jgi:hypothetical protein
MKRGVWKRYKYKQATSEAIMLKLLLTIILLAMMAACSSTVPNMNKESTLKVATFNVSMEATNYVGRDAALMDSSVLENQLRAGHQQIRNIAEIIQRTRPDVILLNEFDYIRDPAQGVERFIKQYLNVAQHAEVSGIDYPYYYYAPVNTGKPSPFDLSGDGKATGTQGDAWGFGFFDGHYAMVLLSRYPIDIDNVRTFQYFKWKDMPNALRPIIPTTNTSFYNEQVWAQIPLSSKSHWDVPVNVNGSVVHVLASHPTPPVFDGPEDRNGSRNHDEVRFWLDYIRPDNASYIYDDNDIKGGLAPQARFVIVGDLNASSTEGDSRKEAIAALLNSAKINDTVIPQSIGGDLHKPNNDLSKYHTAYWGMRADYILPSRFGFELIDNGVYWPAKDQKDYRLIKDREASSDHRLVWSLLTIKSQ